MSEKIRIGFIGAGGIARSHMRRLREIPEAEVVAFAEPSEGAMARMAAEFPEIADRPVYADYREMLAQVPMEAVEIHTPHTLHFQQVMDALAADKAVLVEKPMVCTAERARRLIEAAQGKILMISYQRHFQGPYVYIRQRIQEGSLGEIQYIAALQSQNWYNGTKGKWRQVKALSGGGQLNDSGSHLVDILLWTTGLQAERVYAEINFYDSEVDIDSALTLRFTNGARGTISVVGNSPMWWEEFTVWGSKGAILYRNGEIMERSFEDSEMRRPEALPPDSTPDRNFIDAILGRDEVRVPPECGLRVIELTEAAWRSAELERPVRVSELD